MYDNIGLTAPTSDPEAKNTDVEAAISSLISGRDRVDHPSEIRGTVDLSNRKTPWPKLSGNIPFSPLAGPTPTREAEPTIPTDPINPDHYRRHPSGIECIEVTRHMNFNVGNAIKYLWRYMDKGDPIENLKKAQWYIDDEIRRLEGKR